MRMAALWGRESLASRRRSERAELVGALGEQLELLWKLGGERALVHLAAQFPDPVRQEAFQVRHD